eukprot:1181637-Prorocentrum_minimum.AAC.2
MSRFTPPKALLSLLCCVALCLVQSGLVRENETIKRQLKELATTTEELEERLKQPPPSLPTTHHDDDGVDQILLQLFVPTSHCSVKCSTLPSVGGFDSGYHLHMCVRELSC